MHNVESITSRGWKSGSLRCQLAVSQDGPAAETSWVFQVVLGHCISPELPILTLKRIPLNHRLEIKQNYEIME